MKNIIAIGGQGFLKECIYYISLKDDINFKGILSIDNFIPKIENVNFMGKLSEYTIDKDDYFIICSGSPSLRKEIFDAIYAKGGKFYTLLHNTKLNSTIELGEGNIFVNCDLTIDIKIGNGNLFNNRVAVGHDVKIGDFNFIASNSQLLGNVKIGNNNTIGTSSVLLPNSKIGDNNMISPLSAVYKGCKNNSYMQGNPALKVGIHE